MNGLPPDFDDEPELKAIVVFAVVVLLIFFIL